MSILSGAGKVIGPALNYGLPAWGAYSDIKEGKGVVKSIAKAGVDWAVGDAVFGMLGMGPGLVAMGGMLAVGMADAALTSGREDARNLKKKFTGTGRMGAGLQNDSEFAATMRQRQLQQMGGHQGIARQALGSEARRRAAGIRY